MRTSTTFSRASGQTSRALGRRVVAAAASLGMAFALTACSSDEGGDTGSAAGQSATSEAGAASGEAGSGEEGGTETVAEEPAKAPGERAAGAPDAPIEQLVLNAQDAPEFSLVAIPASQIAESVKAMSGMAEGAQVDPPECDDVTKATMEAQTAPDTTAMQTGNSGGTPVSVAVSTVTSGIEGQRDMAERCPTMTMTLQGGQATVESTNTIEDVPAPDGVEHFVAISQDSTTKVGDANQTTSGYTINGVVRGIGITVTTVGATGPTTPAAREAALAMFTKQAEKITNA